MSVLVKVFDFELSPDFDVDKFYRGMKEEFTLGRGDLIARVRKRS